MKSISFKNFRKFESFPSNTEEKLLDLKNITILVGRNNAGKSTMVKALILLLENLKRQSLSPFSQDAYFNFRSDKFKLHVDTFNRALFNLAVRKEITFNAEIENFYFEIDVQAADDTVLYNHLQSEEDSTAPITRILVRDNERGVQFVEYPFLSKFEIDFKNNALSAESIAAQKEIKEIQDKIKVLKQSSSETIDLEKAALYNTEIKELETRLKNKKKLLGQTGDEHVEFNGLTLAYSDEWNSLYPVPREIKALSDVSENTFIFAFDVKAKAELNKNLPILKANSAKLNAVSNALNSLLANISINYLQAHLASQEIMLSPNDQSNVMYNIIDDYKTYTEKYDKDGAVKRFIKTWMDEAHFNIGKDFEIQQYPGHNYVMKVQNFNESWVNIADMGMGTNQLLILLFQIANSMSSSMKKQKDNVAKELFDVPRSICPLILIEEPEQNLHPRVQSLLADFLLEVATKYQIRFLIETHSEYIIRKTQVKVAEAKFKNEKDLNMNNPFVVYYFDDEKGVQEMKYGLNGVFANKFGTGFFDESSKLSYEVIMASQK